MAVQTTLSFIDARPTIRNGNTWSVSRDSQLQVCERKYYFQYLAGGRVNSSDPELKRLGLLKKLQTIPMWQGDCLHWAIARFLAGMRDNRPPSSDFLLEGLSRKMRQEWLFSEQRRYRQQPALIGKCGLALLEHEYDELPATVTADSVFAEVAAMLDRFLVWAGGSSDLMTKLTSADNVWIEPPTFGADAPGFRVDGVQVLAKVDLALETSGAHFEVYDWKSGEPRATVGTTIGQNELQVRVYQLWPHLEMELPLELISSHLVYLGGTTAEVRTHRLDERVVPLTMTIVRDSIAKAQRWSENFLSGEMRLEDLDYASSVSFCRQCPFKGLCRESLSHEIAY